MRINIQLLAAALCMSVLYGKAQETPAVQENIKKHSAQYIVNINTDNWQKSPSGIKNNILKSRGTDVLFIYNTRFGKSKLSIGIGAGISSMNFSNSGQIINVGDTFSLMMSLTTDYKKNKQSLTYFDVPLELQFATRPSSPDESFHIALGVKGEYLFNSHLKRDDFKMKNIPHINKYQYGVTMRIGYGWFGLSGYYALNSIFRKDKGPDIIPFSAGIALFPLLK